MTTRIMNSIATMMKHHIQQKHVKIQTHLPIWCSSIMNAPPKQILGRWNIESCNKRLDKKIDLSNEDHCGPCGQYLLTVKNDTHIDKTKYKRRY